MTIYEVHRLLKLEVQPHTDYDVDTVNAILKNKYPHLLVSVYHYDKGVCILGIYIETHRFEQYPIVCNSIKTYSTILKNALKEILNIDLSSMNIMEKLEVPHEVMNYPEPFVIMN